MSIITDMFRRLGMDAARGPLQDDRAVAIGRAMAEKGQDLEYPDITTLIRLAILPRHKANPSWERLDGAYDAPGRAIAWFTWNDVRYGVFSDTHFSALMAAHAWIEGHPGKDPLVRKASAHGVGHLTFRTEIKLADIAAVHIQSG